MAAEVATQALASRVLCEVCEPIHEWRQAVQETIEELMDPRWVREAVRKCNRKRKWWKRWACKVKKIVGYVFRLIIAILLVPGLVVLWVLELNACGA